MTIQYASDLHLEMAVNQAMIHLHPLIPRADILILAGDVTLMEEEHLNVPFFDTLSEQFEQIYIVPGNHEFYRESYPVANTFPSFELKIRSNITYVNNKSISFGDVDFFFTTLWARINKFPEIVVTHMNDFRVIKYSDNGKWFGSDDFNYCHESSVEFLERELTKSTNRKVVVSHHCPLAASWIPDLRNPQLHEAYCTDQTNLMSQFNIDHWIYGHTHMHHDSIKVNSTLVHTNPFGYDMHKQFDQSRILEV